ncbi:MAG: hypothetical protein CMC10_08380 [Flavobacteriaceae bacterium]|nr:hypothetical protein [Flavobacteriaceae bacterium]|tara:strand:+ start:60 stop:806 length:747 start_codon:yes stop_codon:yes gene_type:complete
MNRLKLIIVEILKKLNVFCLKKFKFKKFENDLVQKSLQYNFCTTNESILFNNITIFNKINKNHLNGCIIECGIEGGISLVFFHNLLVCHNINNINIYGFDTFEGVPEPEKYDITAENIPMMEQYKNRLNQDGSSGWNNVSLDDVKNNVNNNTNKSNKIFLIKGKVEDTLLDEKNIPQKIFILKIDVALYEGTKIILEKLFKKIQKGGVLILDNYGTYKGIKKAVDEFFFDKKYKLNYNFLTRRVVIYI